MSKKKIVGIVAALVLTAAYIGRVIYVNQGLEVAKTKTYALGELVPYENDFTDGKDTCANGYSVKVLGSELLTINDFYQKYNLGNGQEVDSSIVSHYYVVHVEFINKDNDNSSGAGISLYQTPLVGTDYFMIIDRAAFTMMYPDMPGLSFALRTGSSMDFYLPYPVNAAVGKSLAELQKDPPKLQLTEFPTRKQIKIVAQTSD